MDKKEDWDQRTLLNELVTGKELATQLQVQLNDTSSSRESKEMLLQKILSSFENALLILNGGVAGGTMVVFESSSSMIRSPQSDDSDPKEGDGREVIGSKKRRTTHRWVQEVRADPLTMDIPLDDGFCWRKYGQKDILGARYPRGYYRCVHRNSKSCLATKHVQRSDEDPTLFNITYSGLHTCVESPLLVPPLQAVENTEKIKKSVLDIEQVDFQSKQTQIEQNELFVNLNPLDQSFLPFHFPSTSILHVGDTNIFLPPLPDESFMKQFASSSSSVSAGNTSYPIPPLVATSSMAGRKLGESQQLEFDTHSELDCVVRCAATVASITTSITTTAADFLFSDVGFDRNFSAENK